MLIVACSLAARHLVSDAMDMTSGIIIDRHGAEAFYSHIPAHIESLVAKVEGVTNVVPEFWAPAPEIDGEPLAETLLIPGLPGAPLVCGIDPERRARLRLGGLHARSLVAGRLFTKDETRGVLVSSQFARERHKRPGSPLRLGDHELEITGIFETGVPLLDSVIVLHEDEGRAIAEVPSSAVSCLFLEVAPGEEVETVVGLVRAVVPAEVDVVSTRERGRWIREAVASTDPYLTVIGAVAAVLGSIGIVNTMLMSVRDRVRELGILRATGWKRRNIFRLIVSEAALLGAVGGTLAALGARAGSFFLPIEADISFALVGSAWLGAMTLGVMSGLYPAIEASRVDPMVAIRGGVG